MNSVFKYCSAHGGLAILSTLSLKITPPDQFNDPFEFTPHVVSSAPGRQIKRLLKNKRELREMFEDDTKDGSFKGDFRDYRKHMRKKRADLVGLVPDVIPKTDIQLQHELLARMSTRFGVLCLTDKPDSIVMWGHYGDKHHGIVIGFDVGWPLFREKRGLQSVKYVKERVRWDLSKPEFGAADRESIDDLIFSKNDEWKYESELRQLFALKGLIRRKRSDGRTGRQIVDHFQPFPPKAVVSVCLGANSSLAIEQEVRRVLATPHFAHVVLQRASLHDRRFELVLGCLNLH